MRVIVVASIVVLASCGGSSEATSSSSAGGSTSGATSTGTGTGTSGSELAVHAGSGCTGHDADREAMCLAEGCQWGQELVCSGIRREPDPSDAARPCACICEDDLMECASVP